MLSKRMMAVIFLTSVTPLVSRGEVRVSMEEALKAVVRKVHPVYNPMAKQVRVQGDVEVEVGIGMKGEVESVKVVSGNPLLTPPVLRSVKQWKFTPFQESGKASPAVTVLRFSFRM